MRPISILMATGILCGLIGIVASAQSIKEDFRGSEGSLKVGVSKIDITPDGSIRLSGYGGRSEPSNGVAGKLWARALAIGEGDDVAIVVTLDLIGVPSWLKTSVVKALEMPESKIALCATHTHSGPHLKKVLDPIFMADFPPDHWQAIEAYSEKLTEDVISVCRQAINNRSPGLLSWGQGKVEFARNRRVIENGKWTGFGVQPDGAVDHSLPVLKVNDHEGNQIAVLASYACHCTTLGGSFNQVHGDWAGAAQRIIEEENSGITAMIAIGCGADANPFPRGNFENVIENATQLAREVDRLLAQDLKPLKQAPTTQIDQIELPLDPLPERSFWEMEIASESRTAYYAKKILERMDAGEALPRSIEYPIQTWTFGDDLAIVFLAGEVVVDYALKIKERIDANRVWVNAYANASPSYIPSRKMYDEGGYEVDRSMYYYDKPVRLGPDTEDLVLDEVIQQLPRSYYSETTLRALPAPIAKEDALSTIQVHPDLEIEMVASEPLIADPIDIAWDIHGRMWVVEMSDYPLGIEGKEKGGGRVRFLEDSNDDGVYDTSTVFLDDIPFPTSVYPYNGGALIVSPPDILFARDAVGDGRADEFSVLYTGLAQGNEQHLANGMNWGLDGWIYLANGDSGGKVRSTQTNAQVDISGRDFRIRPETGEIESIAGRSQFGRNRDSLGNWFGNSNSWPGWHFALDSSYLQRNPHVRYADSRVHLPAPSEEGRVFPISKTLSRFNDYERSNRFTSACGFMIYDDSALGREFIGNSFVSEPVHNLVSRALIHPDGATFRSERAAIDTNSEFLSSTDNWFRPAAIRSGPDGAIYIVDMYRFAIEHPQWIPDDWQRKLNLRDGHDKGRIYRVSQKGRPEKPYPAIDTEDTDTLVAALNSDIRWRRDIAQRHLLKLKDPDIIPKIRAIATSSQSPKSRIQALWTLHLKSALTTSDLLAALGDPDPAVRVNAIQLSDPQIHLEPILEKIVERTHDSDEKSRLHAIYALGESSDKRAADALGKSAAREGKDRLFASAALSSIIPHQEIVVSHISDAVVDPDYQFLLDGIASTAFATGSSTTASKILKAILEKHGERSMEDCLNAYRVFKNAQNRINLSNPEALSLDSAVVKREVEFFETIRAIVENPSASPQSRILAMRALALSPIEDPTSIADLALKTLTPGNPLDLQRAAVDCAAQILQSKAPYRLLESWNHTSPQIRNKILDTLFSRGNWTKELAKFASQQSDIAKALNASQRNLLIRHRDPEIRELSESIFSGLNDSDRHAAIQAYQPALQIAGDANSGRERFVGLCATCHELNGIGVPVGPDIAALSNKSPSFLLEAIIDPNRAVESKFHQFVATTRSGETAVGILSEESLNSVTLTTIGGENISIPRTEILSMESSAQSLMPDGLESELSHQEMADLIAFLTQSNAHPQIRMNASGELSLLAQFGQISGRSAYYNIKTEAIEWIQPGDMIEWTAYDLEPGYYDIFGNAGLKDPHEGRPLTLHMNERFVTGAVPYSRNMNQFRRRKFGAIKIDEPIAKAVFRLEHSIDGAEFALKELRLIRVE